ncbi:Tripartite ATP-independent transporter, DctQ component [Tropicibacter naphthalenivorans]|uniref:TRAP transporter small permease protein n=2 Tax=Tropicibacter naphthalenivorans TaxID=441103 RepID=A0A0P1G7A6_9RHOB|nr:TRAP transporter small permease subunit [Tropicibacter naphthalenivorans]CUH77580.1 TRAP-type mannitol/chloroaromatic compound transport system, small permease component [Tropicibacter naphthalenivorans]SMC56288.1 Tripartite ATP-independent transporter, DctQ component [Tropicibacter naphthalenivorans]
MDDTGSDNLIVWILTEMVMGIVHIFQGIWMALFGLFKLVTGYRPTYAEGESAPVTPFDWIGWNGTTEAKQSLMQFVYYGGSVEFFFIMLDLFLIVFIAGVFFRPFLWRVVRVLEGFANTVGRFFAWAGLLMVLQQVIIVFMQRIFTRPDIVFGFGIPLDFDISWYAEELKLYNAMVVALCLTYTFVQGGHVRVDLVYSAVSHRTKRVIDMFGSLAFMLPMAVMIWMYNWFFLWRSLIVPPVSPSDPLQRLEMKARALRWNVETIGFSPNGFTAYFLFKMLMVALVGMIFIQAWAFFYRSYLEWVEGPESEGKYLDKDVLEEGEEPYDHAEF